jgi:MoaA/NifB/PqqE/SkfB family radical SAM enzyme
MLNNSNKNIIIIDYNCNQNCKFCATSDFRKEKISLKEIKKIVDNAINSDKELIVISGGEPTLRNDLYKIIKHIKKIAPRKNIELTTNGMRLSNKKYIKSISDIDRIIFSIHGPNKKVHDSITQVPESFDLAIKGLKNAKELGIESNLYYVVTSENQKGLDKFIKNLFESKLIKNAGFAYPFCDGNVKKNPEILPTIEHFNKTLKKIFENIKIKDIRLANCAHLPLCLLDKNILKLAIKNFDSYTDENYEIDSKIKKHSNPNSDQNFGSHFEKPKECKKCSKNSLCYGFWKTYVKTYGFDEVKPFD